MVKYNAEHVANKEYRHDTGKTLTKDGNNCGANFHGDRAEEREGCCWKNQSLVKLRRPRKRNHGDDATTSHKAQVRKGFDNCNIMIQHQAAQVHHRRVANMARVRFLRILGRICFQNLESKILYPTCCIRLTTSLDTFQ